MKNQIGTMVNHAYSMVGGEVKTSLEHPVGPANSKWTSRRSILKIPHPKFLCRFVTVPVWQGARVSQPKNNSMAEKLMVMLTLV